MTLNDLIKLGNTCKKHDIIKRCKNCRIFARQMCEAIREVEGTLKLLSPESNKENMIYFVCPVCRDLRKVERQPNAQKPKHKYCSRDCYINRKNKSDCILI